MSAKGKKSGKKKTNKTLGGMGDVTIHDFANAKVSKSRVKKSVSSVTQVMKKMEIDDRAWDEKVEEFEGDFDFVEQENEDGTTSVVIKKSEARRRRKKTMSETDVNDRGGLDYPLDIWFLISEYITPEDVGRFAGICKSTYTVVCSAKFWFSLYKRYYKSTPTLPERLQPECMVRLYGLRACVIRSLYYMYPRFRARNKVASISKDRPDNLLKRQCTLMWHKKIKNQWLYYFKFKEHYDLSVTHDRRRAIGHQPDLIEMLEDVSANNEDGCRVLRVTCPHFVSIPLVMGLTLSSVSMRFTEGFRHYIMQMGFGSGLSYTSKTTDGSSYTEFILDPVINYRVLDWWHPLYPHSQTTPFLLNQE